MTPDEQQQDDAKKPQKRPGPSMGGIEPVRVPEGSRWANRIPFSMRHEMIDKAEDNLRQIGQVFNNNLLDLPVEVQRTVQIFQQPRFLQDLDMYLRFHVLDGFLRKHSECRALLAFIFATRYTYLDPEATNYLCSIEGHSVSLPAFQPIIRPKAKPWINATLQRNPSLVWDVDEDSMLEKVVNDAAARETMQAAVMAYDCYDICHDPDPVLPSKEGMYLSRDQLHYLERLVSWFNTGGASSGKHQVSQSPGESESGPSEIRDRSRQLPYLPSETRVVIEIPSPSPAPEDEGLTVAMDVDSPPTPYGPREWQEDKYKDSSDADQTLYRGWVIQPPPYQLEKAKEFLSKAHHVDDLDWNKGYTELGEYLAFLLQTYDGEDWGIALREVVDMFRAQTVFEDYHSKNPGLDPDDKEALTIQALGQTGLRREADPEFGRPMKPVVSEIKGQSHAGIVLDAMAVNEPPYKESRDPLSFTRWHQRLVRNQTYSATITAQKSDEESYILKRTNGLEGNRMVFAGNYNGPVVGHLMEVDMYQRWSLASVARKTHLSLKRLLRLSPRPFLVELLRFVELGATGTPHEELGLSFDRKEQVAGSEEKLRYLENGEELWFGFLEESIPGAGSSLGNGSRSWRLQLLSNRVQNILRSVVMSGLGGGKKVPLADFMAELNLDCRGPAKKYRFTEDEVVSSLPELKQMGLIRSQDSDGTIYLDRCIGIDPERCMRWPDTNPPQPPETGPVPQHNIASATHEVQPRIDRARFSTTGAAANPEEEARDLKKSHNFYYCLGYRLGRMQSEVEANRTADKQTLQDPMRRGANAACLQEVLTRWSNNTKKEKLLPCRGGKVVTTYRDVVMAAEPEAFEAAWAGKPEGEVESLCKELVRKKLLQEASENKTMLWPQPVPRDSDQVAPEGTVIWKPTLQRREPLWAFAQFQHRPWVKKQAWNLKRWPHYRKAPAKQATS